jgi:hypothetical protein
MSWIFGTFQILEVCANIPKSQKAPKLEILLGPTILPTDTQPGLTTTVVLRLYFLKRVLLLYEIFMGKMIPISVSFTSK